MQYVHSAWNRITITSCRKVIGWDWSDRPSGIVVKLVFDVNMPMRFQANASSLQMCMVENNVKNVVYFISLFADNVIRCDQSVFFKWKLEQITNSTLYFCKYAHELTCNSLFIISNWIRTSLSHTFLTDNHVRLHCSQTASYTGNVCDLHPRLTAKPHMCVICGTFHTEVNIHLPLCSTYNLLIKR